MRRLTLNEAKACHFMLVAKYRGGEKPDTLADSALDYLIARGWKAKAARRRAHEAAMKAVAAVDGASGAFLG